MQKTINSLKQKIKHNNFLFSLFYIPIQTRKHILKIYQNYRSKYYCDIISRFEYGYVSLFVNEFKGSFEFDIRSDILKRIIISKEYEREIVELIKLVLNTKKDVIDIGANIGLFSVYFAKNISNNSKVLSIEPTPRAIELLKRNLQTNQVDNSVILFNGVATNLKGTFKIKTIPGREEYSTLGSNIHQNRHHGTTHQEITVEGDTIDNLVNRFGLNPGFIKIDTEGAEYLVLQGAEITLRKYHPVLLMELMDDYLVNFGYSAKQVSDFLELFGYKITDISTGQEPMYPFNGSILALATQ